MVEPLKIQDLEAFVFRAPSDPPVQTSFGIMRDRPAVLIRVTDGRGVYGWGEIWCNFPTVGAEHRARLALALVKPLVLGQEWENPQVFLAQVTQALAVLMLQTGEHGPIHQVIAGVEQALWDLAARRAGLPLWRLLAQEASSTPNPRIAVYASGINPTNPAQLALRKRDEGYRAFKLKVGFGTERDEANLRAMRDALGAEATLMVDANQAWNVEQAREAGVRMEQYNLLWMEEPLRADSTLSQWQSLAGSQPLRLAGGENLTGLAAFDAHMASGVFGVIQPDVGKWGGLGGALAVADMAKTHDRWFCPHWLGGGIGLLASMHLKAAVGGPGYVEVDANPNPLREGLAMPAFRVDDGYVTLSERPGLGAEPDLPGCAGYRVEIPLVGI